MLKGVKAFEIYCLKFIELRLIHLYFTVWARNVNEVNCRKNIYSRCFVKRLVVLISNFVTVMGSANSVILDSIIWEMDFIPQFLVTISSRSCCIDKCTMTSSNGNTFFVTGPFCGEFTGHQWIPLTEASDAELWCFLWSAPWVNNQEAGDLRRHRTHYDVTAMEYFPHLLKNAGSEKSWANSLDCCWE